MLIPGSDDKAYVLNRYKVARTTYQLPPLRAMKSVWQTQAQICFAYLMEGKQPLTLYVRRWIAADEYLLKIAARPAHYWTLGRKVA